MGAVRTVLPVHLMAALVRAVLPGRIVTPFQSAALPVKVTFFRDVQPSKASFLTSTVPRGMVTEVRLVQSLNIHHAISLRFAGRRTLVRLVQSIKVQPPASHRLSGRVTDFRDAQP